MRLHCGKRMRSGSRAAQQARWLACVGVVALLLAAPSPARSPTLRVGTSGDYAPFSEQSDGERSGFDVEIARRFARDAGLELAWVPFRWPDLTSSLREGRFDVAMSGVTVRPERSVAGRFSIPVAETGAVLLIRDAVRARLVARAAADAPGSEGTDLTALDVPSLRIAVNAGGHLERVTRAHFHAAAIRAIPDNAAVPRALADGEVDAVVSDGLEAPHWLASLSGVSPVGPFTRDWKAYWLPAQDAELARRLDAWLLARERDGSLAALRARWLGEGARRATARPDVALVAACDERLALMPYVAGFKRAHELQVVDPAREEKVLAAGADAVVQAARRRGVPPPDPAAVRRFYRAQIDAAVELQRAVASRPGSPEWERFDLREELRPALLRIGERMADLVVAVAVGGGEVRDAPALAELVASVLDRHGLSAERRAAIAEAIAGLATGPRERGDGSSASSERRMLEGA